MREMVTKEKVLQALGQITDPDLHKNIVELGFVKNLAINGGKVAFSIELTTPACPIKDAMKIEAQKVVSAIPGVESVAIDMTSKVTSATNRRAQLKDVKNIIAVASGKGGVGKSTVASGLAVSLAKEGAKVGLMDLDVWGPSIPLMMGIKFDWEQTSDGKWTPKGFRTLNGKMLPVERHGLKIMSIGFFLREDDPVIWRGPMVHHLIRQFSEDVAWGELDYLVCDLPPGTGDVQISLCQLLPPTGAVLVSTPQDVALLDVGKAISMFRKVNTPILGIIENMSYYECPQCSHRANLFGHGGAEKSSQKWEIPFLGRIPLDIDVRTGGDRGEPLAAKQKDSPAGKAFFEAAHRLAAQVSILNAQEKQSVADGEIAVHWAKVPVS